MAANSTVYSYVQRVRYAETDAMGIVWHGNYLLWFEVARVETLRAIGYPYTRLEQEGYGLPLIEAHLHYGKAARFDDTLKIEVWVEEIKSRKFRLSYRITNTADNSECCTGHTEHVCWRDGTIALLPAELRERLKSPPIDPAG